MTRLFGRMSTPFTLWLLLVLAIALLVNVSTTAAARAEPDVRGPSGAPPAADVGRALGALRAFAEQIDRPAPIIHAAYPIHPALGDGSPAFLRAASDRVIRVAARRLALLAAAAPDGGSRAAGLQAIMTGLQDVRLRLVSLDVAADPDQAARARAEVETILGGMQHAWLALDPVPAGDAPEVPPSLPVVLRGTEL